MIKLLQVPIFELTIGKEIMLEPLDYAKEDNTELMESPIEHCGFRHQSTFINGPGKGPYIYVFCQMLQKTIPALLKLKSNYETYKKYQFTNFGNILFVWY